MLNLILGRAGSGKTDEIWSRIAAKAADEAAKILLIVPEQMSFESERMLLRRIPAAHASRVQVLNFSRLVSEASRLYGGFAGRRIDDGGRMIMMLLALKKVSDMLTLYRSFVKSPPFASEMLSVVSEFKQCAFTPGDLLDAAEKLPGGELKYKMREISLIMGTYEALVGASYLDAQDDLTRLYDVLKTRDYFAGCCVYLDGFKGFTAQQLRLISLMLRDAESVTLSLTADKLGREESFGLFANIRQTAADIIRMAREQGRAVTPPHILPPGIRFKSDSLKALELSFFAPDYEVYEGDAPEVTLAQAQTLYDEVELAAREIRRLMRQEGYRCREIAVIARDLEPYRGMIESVFPKYKIPYFLDSRRSVESQPLMRFVLAAMEAALSEYSSDAIFELLKTGAAGFDLEAVSELENYTYIWNITGPRWQEPFTADPEGFTESPMDAGRQARLDLLNRSRRRVIEPLSRLKAALSTSSPRRMLHGLYRFLEDMEAAEALSGMAGQFEADGELLEARMLRQSWDVLMNCFDQLALTLEDYEMSSGEFHQLLTAVIAAQDLGAIPPELDEVNIGDALRMRPASPRAVFVLGACEGVFPRAAAGGGLLSQTERARLIEAGLAVTGSAEKEAVEERYLAYHAVCSASERVYVFCARSDSSGKARFPSELFTQVREILPRCRILHPGSEGILGLESRAAALEAAARGIRGNSAEDAAVRCWLSKHEPEQLGRMRLILRRTPAAIRQETAKRLYSDNIVLSASRLETFYKCPFSYFCRYGLRAQPLRRAEIDVLRRGTLIHFVLERILSDYQEEFKTLPQDILREEIESLLQEYLDTVMGGAAEKSRRFLYQLERIRQMLLELLCQLQLEFSQSSFTPAAFELPLGEGGVPPATLPLPSGGNISVYGSVDRVDTWVHEGKTYLRIVDYKSGTRKFQLYDVLYGQNLQMLIYLFAVCENGSERLGGELVPAGILYLPAKRMLGEDSGSGEADETDLAKKYKMSGLVLEDDRVIEAMEPGGRGIFIPVKRVKSGALHKGSNTVTAEGLSLLHRHINEMLVRMGERLKSGDAAISPLDGSVEACKYCDYACVCRKEPDAVNPSIPKLKPEQVLETLAEQYSEEGRERGHELCSE